MTIEAYIIEKLNEALDVPVYAEEPHDDLSEYVVIEKTGSSKTNHIEECTVTFKSYSDISMLKAAELNEAVKDAVEALIEYKEISRAELNSDYNYTDTSTKRYRYQAVFDLVHFL